ncbi:MAG: NAD(P)/FAD-dependent oxidoreductase [Alphaproteobacteria bacterium]|nr:NAD(P)/FAD-dependent oxidoreductase [Alphaproteobacteria bacterium]
MIIIGAGVAGLAQLMALREAGVGALILEAGDRIGGTWRDNRYPGARCDSEAVSYQFLADPALAEGWSWMEVFAAGTEVLAYLEHVARSKDLLRSIHFGVRVRSARWDGEARLWRLTDDTGGIRTARHLISAMGALSQPKRPLIDGFEAFEGELVHTAEWPDGGVALTGRRVAVLGTGASGVQVIPPIAREAGHLTVLQRRPHWCLPLNNGPAEPLGPEERRVAAADAARACAKSEGAFLHTANPRRALGVSAERRERVFQALYDGPGLGFWFGNYRDVLTDPDANALACAFLADKIRARLDDPGLAGQLVPTEPFGARRPPLEQGYYEVFNRSNVDLVSLAAEPIRRALPEGLELASGRVIALDLLVLATGFEAVTGPYRATAIYNGSGERLDAGWPDEIATHVGVMAPGFPNFFMLGGPQSAAVMCNQPRCLEMTAQWVASAIGHAERSGAARVEARAEAVAEWGALVDAVAPLTVIGRQGSWFTGAPDPGQSPRPGFAFLGGAPAFRAAIEADMAQGHASLMFEGPDA